MVFQLTEKATCPKRHLRSPYSQIRDKNRLFSNVISSMFPLDKNEEMCVFQHDGIWDKVHR